MNQIKEIFYEAEIISTLDKLKVMDVVFRSEGRPDVQVGMPIPDLGANLKEWVRPYAPLRYWYDLERQVEEVEVGTKIFDSQCLPGIPESPSLPYNEGEFIQAARGVTVATDVAPSGFPTRYIGGAIEDIDGRASEFVTVIPEMPAVKL